MDKYQAIGGGHITFESVIQQYFFTPCIHFSSRADENRRFFYISIEKSGLKGKKYPDHGIFCHK